MDLGALELALAQHAQPGRVEELRDRPLPAGMTELLRAALGQDDVVDAAARCHQASRGQIVDAARFFIEQQVLARVFESDPWRQLGLAPDADEEQLKIHHRLLVRLVHPDRSDDWADAYADRVNRAWRQLRDPDTRQRATAAAAAVHQGWGRTATATASMSRAALVVAAPEPAASATARASRPGLWIAMAGMALVASVTTLIWLAGPQLAQGPDVGEHAAWPPPPDMEATAIVANAATLEPGAAPALPTPVPIALLIPNPESEPAAATPSDPAVVAAAPAPTPAPTPASRRVVPARTPTPKPAPPVADTVVAVAAEPVAASTAAATDAPTPVAVPVPVAVLHTLPSDGETIALIDRYADRYAAGDLDGVLALFASDVHADSARVAPIASGLAQTFRNTSRRDLRIERMQWQRHPDRITGQARYRLSQQVRGGFVRRTEQGRIEFELVRDGDDARLRQLVTRPDPRS